MTLVWEICLRLSCLLIVPVPTRKLTVHGKKCLNGYGYQMPGNRAGSVSSFCMRESLRLNFKALPWITIFLAKGWGQGRPLHFKLLRKDDLCRCNMYLQLNTHTICKNLEFCTSYMKSIAKCYFCYFKELLLSF